METFALRRVLPGLDTHYPPMLLAEVRPEL